MLNYENNNIFILMKKEILKSIIIKLIWNKIYKIKERGKLIPHMISLT